MGKEGAKGKGKKSGPLRSQEDNPIEAFNNQTVTEKPL